MRLNSAKDLDVYKMAYQSAMEVFELSKQFPPEERFALEPVMHFSLVDVAGFLEHQRCSIPQPKVGATQERLPWEGIRKSLYSERVAAFPR